MVTLASQPLCNKFRDMKQGHVTRMRNPILKEIKEHYGPVVLSGPLEKLQELLTDIVIVMEAGEKVGEWKPSRIKEAIRHIKNASGSLTLARVFATSAGGRQMLLDAEACTKKSSKDVGGDLLLKKAVEQEGLNLKLLPLTHLEQVAGESYHEEYLRSNLTFRNCSQMLDTSVAMTTKVIQALDKWSPAGLEDQQSALVAWELNAARTLRAVIARMCSEAKHCLEGHIAGLPCALAEDGLAEKIKMFTKAISEYKEDIKNEQLREKFHAAVTAFTSYLKKAGREDHWRSGVQAFTSQSKGLADVLEFLGCLADLGVLAESPSLDNALQAWAAGSDESAEPSEKPYMQMVVDFISKKSELSDLCCDAAPPSLSTLYRAALGHGLVSAVQTKHCTGNISEALLAFKQSICASAFCIPASADLGAAVARFQNCFVDDILQEGLQDVHMARSLAAKVSFEGKPSVRMTASPHERSLSVVNAAISAMGEGFDERPHNLFEGIWDDAVETANIQKALELCSMQSSLTSIAVCLCHGHDGCTGVRELITEGKQNLSCANALRSVELISGALQQEVEAKQHFFPPVQQAELSGYSRICQLSLALQNRLRSLYLTRVVEQCQARAEDMTKACPSWTKSITPTSMNMAASKKLFFEGDAMAQVSPSVRAFVLQRTATQEVFKVFGQDFAADHPDVFENLLDSEVHARLTCAVKSAINIIANNSKNPKCGTLITELYALMDRQTKGLPKLKDGTQKSIELPASLKAALEKLKDKSGAATSAASSKQGSASASSSLAAHGTKRPGSSAASCSGASCTSAASGAKRFQRG